MVQRFKDDDAGFRNWRDQGPDGFVVNTSRTPSPNYLILHRASCRSLAPANEHERNWTMAYIKFCALQPEDLEKWARQHVTVDAQLKPCSNCRP
jgi:hypothetical protein